MKHRAVVFNPSYIVIPLFLVLGTGYAVSLIPTSTINPVESFKKNVRNHYRAKYEKAARQQMSKKYQMLQQYQKQQPQSPFGG